jgi:hypothetical protein
MSSRQNLAIGLTVLGLAIGANQALEPRTPDDLRRQQQEQRVEDLGDAVERQNDKHRDDAADHVDAENRRRTTPGEHRPPSGTRLRLP